MQSYQPLRVDSVISLVWSFLINCDAKSASLDLTLSIWHSWVTCGPDTWLWPSRDLWPPLNEALRISVFFLESSSIVGAFLFIFSLHVFRRGLVSPLITTHHPRLMIRGRDVRMCKCKLYVSATSTWLIATGRRRPLSPDGKWAMIGGWLASNLLISRREALFRGPMSLISWRGLGGGFVAAEALRLPLCCLHGG